MDKLGPLGSAGEKGTWCSHCGRQGGRSPKGGTWNGHGSSNFSPGYKPRRAESRTPNHCVRSQQHHPQSPKGRNSQAPVTGRTDKQGVVHRSVEYYSASKRKERLAHTTTWTDGTWRARWARPARHRGRTRYDPLLPGAQESNSRRRKVDGGCGLCVCWGGGGR